MYTGFLITFEGGEGAGKTTQIDLLRSHIQAQGHDVVCTREPGGTAFAESIRCLLVADMGNTISPACELALLIASRLHHVQTVIKPALQQNKVVLCDRYIDSSVVYQGIAGHLGIERVIKCHQDLMGSDFILPHATICLDIDVVQGLKRSQGNHKNEDRFEKKSLQFHQMVRQGYLKIAQDSDRYTVIDATKNINDISNKIKAVWKNINK